MSPNQSPNYGALTANTWQAPLDLSYEIDLWGRVRRGFESARADAQGSLAAFDNVLLTLQADVAQNYFRLRALDAEIATVTGTVDLRKEQVRLVRSRFNGGIGNDLDIARASIPLSSLEGADPLPPYVRLIHDVLLGDRSLFTRPDGLAAVWKVADPLLSNPPPLVPYAPGSWGPAQARKLIEPGRWLLGQ